jgi:hypothetical protein
MVCILHIPSSYVAFSRIKAARTGIQGKERPQIPRLYPINWLPKKLVSFELSYAQLDYVPDEYIKYTNCKIMQLKLKRSELAAYLNKHFKKLHVSCQHRCKIGRIVRETKFNSRYKFL